MTLPMRMFLARLASVLLVVGSVLSSGCRSAAPTPPHRSATPVQRRPQISLKHGTRAEQETQHQLERLLDQHDLSPWTFTDKVEIDEESIPHSHPVLTLHTRHLRDDLLLLATYIHEQSHHFCQQHRAQVGTAMAEVEAMFPGMPVGFPDGANDKDSSYEHLSCVIPLEHAGLRALVGELTALQVIQFWAQDHYRVLYGTFAENRRKIWSALEKTGLELPQ